MFHCPPFDLDDRDLIEGARRTGQPEHIAQAIEASVSGFRVRMEKMRPWPIIDGEISVLVFKPTNFFDDYCMAIVLQEIAEATGMGVARVMMTGSPPEKRPMSPDVEFLPPSHPCASASIRG